MCDLCHEGIIAQRELMFHELLIETLSVCVQDKEGCSHKKGMEMWAKIAKVYALRIE